LFNQKIFKRLSGLDSLIRADLLHVLVHPFHFATPLFFEKKFDQDKKKLVQLVFPKKNTTDHADFHQDVDGQDDHFGSGGK
jgi:hypothetical protein